MKKILIAAHYNMNNGDRAVLEATVLKIKEKFGDDISIVVSAAYPQFLKDERFLTVGWPVRNNRIVRWMFNRCIKYLSLKKFKTTLPIWIDSQYYKAVRDSDAVFISGGHHLTDILGIGNYYALAINYLVPIFMDKPVFLLPQSIGTMKKENRKEICNVEYILKKCKKIAYRDLSSKKFLESLNINKNVIYVPDIVFSIKPKAIERKRKSIAVALYCSYVEEKKKLLDVTIPNLKKILRKMIENGYDIHLISMDTNDVESANDIANDLRLVGGSEVFVYSGMNDIKETISLFSGHDLVLAYKTHSVVFSLINRTPVIAIAYHPKSIYFMQDIGLGKYAINDCDACEEKMMPLIEDALDNIESIKKIEDEGVGNNVKIINEFMDDVLSEEI